MDCSLPGSSIHGIFQVSQPGRKAVPGDFFSGAVSLELGRMSAMKETWNRFLGWKDPLEQGMGTHSSILAWRILHGQRRLVEYSSWSHKELDTTEQLTLTVNYTLL